MTTTTVDFDKTLNSATLSLRPFALRLTKDSEAANDLLQETVLKAFTNKEKFATGTNLKAWLYTIMRNTFITNYQKMVRRNTFIDTTDNQHYINSNSSSIENNAYSSFVMADIDKAIKTLDESYKIPFLMHFKGYKYHEIAEKLDIPIGTVKNRIHIARKELKGALKNYAA